MFITNPLREDEGFGAQFQTIVYAVIYAELNNLKFVYTPFTKMAHNYDNDPDYIKKKENLINFIGNFEINNINIKEKDVMKFITFFENNLEKCINSNSLLKIKNIFIKNKIITDYYDRSKFNIAIHVRRINSHDNRDTDISDDIFLRIINFLKKEYSDKNYLIHIFSQGLTSNFKCFKNEKIVIHLNDSVETCFTSFVLADVLIVSPSSLSYVAGIISKNIIYYIPFWHPPLPGWNSFDFPPKIPIPLQK